MTKKLQTWDCPRCEGRFEDFDCSDVPEGLLIVATCADCGFEVDANVPVTMFSYDND